MLRVKKASQREEGDVRKPWKGELEHSLVGRITCMCFPSISGNYWYVFYWEEDDMRKSLCHSKWSPLLVVTPM